MRFSRLAPHARHHAATLLIALTICVASVQAVSIDGWSIKWVQVSDVKGMNDIVLGKNLEAYEGEPIRVRPHCTKNMFGGRGDAQFTIIAHTDFEDSQNGGQERSVQSYGSFLPLSKDTVPTLLIGGNKKVHLSIVSTTDTASKIDVALHNRQAYPLSDQVVKNYYMPQAAVTTLHDEDIFGSKSCSLSISRRSFKPKVATPYPYGLVRTPLFGGTAFVDTWRVLDHREAISPSIQVFDQFEVGGTSGHIYLERPPLQLWYADPAITIFADGYFIDAEHVWSKAEADPVSVAVPAGFAPQPATHVDSVNVAMSSLQQSSPLLSTPVHPTRYMPDEASTGRSHLVRRTRRMSGGIEDEDDNIAPKTSHQISKPNRRIPGMEDE